MHLLAIFLLFFPFKPFYNPKRGLNHTMSNDIHTHTHTIQLSPQHKFLESFIPIIALLLKIAPKTHSYSFTFSKNDSFIQYSLIYVTPKDLVPTPKSQPTIPNSPTISLLSLKLSNLSLKNPPKTKLD